MARIEFKNDQTRAFEEAEGSAGRLNVSSRSDTRSYYISRDMAQAYSLVFDHQDAAAGEYSVYWKNDSSEKDLVISSLGVNSVNAARVKLWFVSGTAGGGATSTPTNLNKKSSNDADSTSRNASSGSGISGLSTISPIDFVFVQATGHQELRLTDRVRLGQNDAIAIEYDEGTTGDFGGVIFGFFE
jgi:hypothetical protein